MINWRRNLQFGRSIRSQLWVIFIGLVTVPTVCLGILVYSHSASIERQQLDEKLAIIAKDWAKVTQAHQDQIDKVLKREDALVGQKLVTLTGSLLDALDVSRALSGSAQLRANNPVLQKVSQIAIGHSGFAFVLDRQGKYLTSKGNQYNGQTMLSHLAGDDKTKLAALLDHPETVSAAGAYEVRNKFQSESGGDYRDQLTILAYYAPSNVFVGVSSYYTDFQSNDYEKSLQQDVRSKLAQEVVGTKGNIWALNSQGDFIVSRHRLQDNENMRDYRDASGQLFIQNLIAKAKALKKGESFIVKYDWKEVGEKVPATRLAAVTYVPEWDWIIGASTYYSDYQAGLQQLQIYIGLVCLVFIFISSVGAYFFSIRITRPISKLQQLAVQAAAGHLDTRVDAGILRQPNEIGSLSSSFQTMISQLRHNFEKLQEEEATVERQVVQRTAELRLEKAKLKASIDSLPLGFALIDSALTIVDRNKALNTVFQQTGKEWTLEALSKDLGTEVNLLNACKEIIKTKQPITLPEVNHQSTIVRVFLAPAISGDETIGIVMLAEDITDAKILERSKDEFFSIASHELRTPLTSIRGNASMLMSYYADALKDEPSSSMVSDIHESSVRLIEIVNDFLDASRLEQGKISFKFEPLALDKIIQKVADEVSSVIKEKKVYLHLDDTIHDPGKLPQVYGDENRTQQILYNLIGNALKFTEKGGISIRVVRDNTVLKVFVADTGRGMNSDAQKLLFHRFQQANGSLLTRDTTRGTGLGLYISRLLAEGMHGKVWLESSEPGKGTTFGFSIPIATEENIRKYKETMKAEIDSATGLTKPAN
jgi:signal transduction histidine kinase